MFKERTSAEQVSAKVKITGQMEIKLMYILR